MGGMFEYSGTEIESLSVTENYRDWIFSLFAPYFGYRILEVGAGSGNFSSLIVERMPNCHFSLLEPSTNLFPLLQARMGSVPNVRLHNSFLADIHAVEEFDTVVSINVLEHIEDDVQELQHIHRSLEKGGRLLLFVPALQSLYGKFDVSVEHFRRYGRKELSEKLNVTGFKITMLRFFDFVGMIAWFVRFRIFHSRAFPEQRSLALYDRYVVPVLGRVESYVRLPAGKNLICVAQRV
jgi:SAM-dependent methyltransferase